MSALILSFSFFYEDATYRIIPHKPKRQTVLQRHSRTIRHRAAESFCAGNDILSTVDIQVLPDHPHPVDHGVVQEEERVGGRGVEVHHAAADLPVAAAVDAEFVRVRVVALHEGLEVFDVDLIQQEGGEVGVSVVGLGEEGVDVPFEAAGVVFERGVDVVGVGQVEGPEVDDVVDEGARGHAAAACAGRVGYVLLGEPGGGAAGDGLAVAAEGEGVAGEEGGVLRGGGIERPVPVGHDAGVAAEVDEILLEVVGESAVPGEEVGSIVDVHGVVDVGGDEFIEAGLHSGILGCFGGGHDLGLHVLQTDDGVGEGLPRGRVEGAPFFADVCVFVGAGDVAAGGDVGSHGFVGYVRDVLEGLTVGDLL